MKKPTVFIGSSVEHKHLAEVVQSLLDYDVTPVVWTQDTFEPSHFPLESLENSLDLVDFAILICAPEDITTMRGQQHHTVRDNVLFELGLFIGRLSRQRTFLIAPRSQSVHLPSDLSGLSPETYDPALLSTNPEAALGPACGKIKRAIRKLGTVSRPDPAEAPDYQKSHEIPQADEHKFNEVDEPASDWTSTDYRWRYFFALTRDDEPKAQRIADGFLESVASSPESIAEWEAWQQYAAQLAGKGGDLDVIRNKSTLFPQSARLKKLLAQSLLHYGDKESALSLLFEALGQASEMQLAAKIVDQALDIDEPSPHKARTLLDALNRIPRSTSADETSYLDAISKIAKSGGFEEVSKAILEVLLSVQPQDTQTRASLAYSYSEAGEQELSMLHYELVPAQERSGMTWNNLGVAYSRLQLAGKAVASYQVAADKGESIAEGNLAHLLKDAGFFTEAKERAERALKLETPHENVIEALRAIQEARSSEDEEHTKLSNKGQARQRARRDIGRAALSFSGPDIVGKWETSNGLLEIFEDGDGGNSGLLEFERETEMSGLLILFGPTKTKEVIKVEVQLRRFGTALEGKIGRSVLGKPTTILGIGSAERTLVLRISDDAQTMTGFEYDYEQTPIKWKRHHLSKTIPAPLPS